VKGGEEVDGASVVAGGDVSEVFELVEEALDPIWQFVGDGVMRDEDLAGAEGRDNRRRSGLADEFAQGIGVIGLVGDDRGCAAAGEQLGSRGTVVRLAAKAARRFLAKALKVMRNWPPGSITTDKLGSYPKALRRLKRKGELQGTVAHRTSKYLNNRIEADHGALKRLIRPTRGFQSMKTAYATIKGFEIMRMIRRRHCILIEPGVTGEVRFVNKLFDLAA
jgi:transposase, IS6 family